MPRPDTGCRRPSGRARRSGAEPGPLLTRLARWLAVAPRQEPRQWVCGRIAFVQEDRFRLLDDLGRGDLFSLGHRSGVTTVELKAWGNTRHTVHVGNNGLPDQGAVAEEVFPSLTG